MARPDARIALMGTVPDINQFAQGVTNIQGIRQNAANLAKTEAEAELAKKEKELRYLPIIANSLQYAKKNAKDPADLARMFGNVKNFWSKQLPEDAAKINAITLDQIDTVIGGSVPYLDQIKQEVESIKVVKGQAEVEKVRAQTGDIYADNARADLNTGSMVADRAARTSLYGQNVADTIAKRVKGGAAAAEGELYPDALPTAGGGGAATPLPRPMPQPNGPTLVPDQYPQLSDAGPGRSPIPLQPVADTGAAPKKDWSPDERAQINQYWAKRLGKPPTNHLWNYEGEAEPIRGVVTKGGAGAGEVVENPDGSITYKPATKLTEGQSKDVGFAIRARASNKLIDPAYVPDWSMQQGSEIETLGLGNIIAGGDETFSTQQQAWAEFLTAALRKDSGATITPEEWKVGRKNWIPENGDPPAELAQKAASRDRVVQALETGLGSAASVLPEEEVSEETVIEYDDQGNPL